MPGVVLELKFKVVYETVTAEIVRKWGQIIVVIGACVLLKYNVP